jgi:hypothetical protein
MVCPSGTPGGNFGLGFLSLLKNKLSLYSSPTPREKPLAKPALASSAESRPKQRKSARNTPKSFLLKKRKDAGRDLAGSEADFPAPTLDANANLDSRPIIGKT